MRTNKMDSWIPRNSSRSSLTDREEFGSTKRRVDCVARRYYVGFSLIMFAIATVVVVICISTARDSDAQEQVFINTACPSMTFPCKTGGVCVNMSLVCDGISHCDDNSDEGAMCDRYQTQLWADLFKKRPAADREDESINCTLENVSSVCKCREKTKLYCDNKMLATVPSSLPASVTSLDLSGNNFSAIIAKHFSSMTNLQTLIIVHSNVQSIAPGTFADCNQLTTVLLQFNHISRFSTKIFSPHNIVEELNLSGNELKELKKGDFVNMENLKHLYLSRNKIYAVEEGAFESLPNLEILDLRENMLTEIETHFFSSLSNLRKLYLTENGIYRIQPQSFITMNRLEKLDMGMNNIRVLENGVFDGLTNLSTLMLRRNDIRTIEVQAFKSLVNLRSVDLRYNSMQRLQNGTFSHMRHLNFIYFDKFYMCLYASNAKQCEPQGDGISSKDNLLESIILRVCVWIVAILACGGNLLVILGRSLLRADNQIHSFFIKNLSLADLLMGLYLLIIAAHDLKFRGEYIMYDESWRNSWECDVSGLLSTLSTEMSVLTLSVITLDRYLSIMYPLSFRKRGLKLAYLVMAFTWSVCIALAALPIMGIAYFGSSFYRDNAVCIPLHLHNPRAKGWEFSSFLFLGINFGSFGFIAYAYVAMFYSIHMSALPLRTSRESKERCLVKRFFFIVITDFICWIPIIIIKIVALAGVTISKDLYAWVIVFVLPVNSALNPLLYTLTTKLFKKKLLSKFTSVVFRPAQRGDKENSQSRSSVKNNTYLTRPVQDCEMCLLRRYQPTHSQNTGLTYIYSSSNGGSHRHNHHHHQHSNPDLRYNDRQASTSFTNGSTSRSLVHNQEISEHEDRSSP